MSFFSSSSVSIPGTFFAGAADVAAAVALACICVRAARKCRARGVVAACTEVAATVAVSVAVRAPATLCAPRFAAALMAPLRRQDSMAARGTGVRGDVLATSGRYRQRTDSGQADTPRALRSAIGVAEWQTVSLLGPRGSKPPDVQCSAAQCRAERWARRSDECDAVRCGAGWLTSDDAVTAAAQRMHNGQTTQTD